MSRKKFLSVQKDSSMNKIHTNQFEIRVGFGDGGGGHEYFKVPKL